MRDALGARCSNPSENLWGDYIVGRGHPGSPGSGGASPYLNRASPSGKVWLHGFHQGFAGDASIFANLLLTVNRGPDLFDSGFKT
jgi:hypothetical protein